MKTKSNKSNKVNLLVCGSQQFEDKAFVFGLLNQLYEATQHSITNLYTSNFSGACQYAREWLELTNAELPKEKKIIHHDCTFDMHLSNQNISFYDEADIPSTIIKNDPFFIKGKELLSVNKVNMACAFPNQEGVMGASTRNIQRFCQLGEIKFLNGIEAYKLLKDYRNTVEKETTVQHDGLQNHHGMKR